MNRPYFNHSGDKLEKEYRSALKRSDIECLELIATELTHRKTQRALELSEKVQDSLTRLRKKESAPIPSVPKSESLTSPSSRPPKKPSRPTTTPRNRTHTPTLEQAQAIEAFRTGGSLRINAYAGTGKTATLEMLAHSTHRIGQYIAFNRNIVDEAKNKFPEAVNCSTIHGLAFRATPSQYKNNQDKMMGKVNAHKLADLLNLSEEWRVDQNVTLDRVAQAGIILKTVQKFAQSEEADPIESHVPRHGSLLGASESTFRTVQDFALRGARHIWGRMLDANDQLPLGHDGYLKLWALSEPHIAADFILLDEAQDTNPVVLKVLKRQTAQMVYVGDRYQQIYEWRGAVNAMEEINTTHQTHLRRSFRFGDGIAEAATKVLALLGEQSPIQGNPAVSSFLCPTTPDAILEVAPIVRPLGGLVKLWWLGVGKV
jgi:hypothetical protein